MKDPNYKFNLDSDYNKTNVTDELELAKYLYYHLHNYYVCADKQILKNTRRNLPRQYQFRFLWEKICKIDFINEIKEMIKRVNTTFKITEALIDRIYNILKVMLDDNTFVKDYLSDKNIRWLLRMINE
jgi:asparagine synthetase A